MWSDSDRESVVDKPAFVRQDSFISDGDIPKQVKEKTRAKRERPLEPKKVEEVASKATKRRTSVGNEKLKPQLEKRTKKDEQPKDEPSGEEPDLTRFSVVQMPPPQLPDGYYRVDKGAYPGIYVHVGMRSDAVPGITIERLIYEKDSTGGLLVNQAQHAKVKDKGWPSLTLSREEAIRMIAAATLVLRQSGVSVATIRASVDQLQRKHQTD